MMSSRNSAEYERYILFVILKITSEIAVFHNDHGWQIQSCRLLHLRSPSVKRRTDGGNRLRDVVSFSLQTFRWMTLYLHFWPKESYTQEMLVDVSSSAWMWESLFISTSIPDLHSVRLRPFSSKITYGYIWWQEIHVVDQFHRWGLCIVLAVATNSS